MKETPGEEWYPAADLPRDPRFLGEQSGGIRHPVYELQPFLGEPGEGVRDGAGMATMNARGFRETLLEPIVYRKSDRSGNG